MTQTSTNMKDKITRILHDFQKETIELSKQRDSDQWLTDYSSLSQKEINYLRTTTDRIIEAIDSDIIRFLKKIEKRFKVFDEEAKKSLVK